MVSSKWRPIARGVLLIAASALAATAQAVPSFARQTGQNCVACHAGGNFPELTPYGRMFKLTGYTIGERTLPLAVMGVVSMNKTRNTSDPYGDKAADFPKDGDVIFQTGSLFIAGKIADNLGAFAQITYNNYDTLDDNGWHGHSGADNMDFRYADRFISSDRDLIVGVSLNNNPQVQDVWNSVAAWGYNTVPGSSGPPVTPLIAGGLAQSVAGIGGYAQLAKDHQSLYGEVSVYGNADGFFRFMSAGHSVDRGDLVKVKAGNPYFRIAYSREWGASNAMVGVYGMQARVFPDSANATGETTRYRDLGIDAQYQYLLDPHTFTAQASYTRERIDYASSVAGQTPEFVDAQGNPLPDTNPSDTLNAFRLKATYVYRAQYGGSVSFFNVTGSTNTLNQTSGYDPTTLTIAPPSSADASVTSTPVSGNLSGSPGSRGWTGELFWMPWQYVRLGVQYTYFNRFNGASSNYDGFGRNASDNNTVFLYAWGAY